MRIVVDAMGSDRRPAPDIEGAVDAAREYGVEILLVGPASRINQELARLKQPTPLIRVVDAAEVIEMQESPALAVKSKKQSSIVVGIQRVKDGAADAFVSMGNTGAILAASVMYLQRIEGVMRPALATVYPTPFGPILVLDIGANTDCKPEWLEQFAFMGEAYARAILKIDKPRVALLANGEEETKGSQLVQAAHARLKQRAARTGMNFVGNIEGKDIPARAADVVVCDGFDGNVVIKLSEGIAKMLLELIEKEIKSSLVTMIGGALAMPAFRRARKVLDYAEYGGGPLLGVNGVVIIGHGRSNSYAVKNAIRVAVESVERDILGTIRSELAAYA